MVSPQQGKSAATDRENPSGSEGADGATPAKTGAVRIIAHYAMLGFAPVVAVAALIAAVVAFTGNQASQERLNKAAATMDSLSASQAAAKSELDRLRFSMAHEKSRQDEVLMRQEEREAKIIQSINQLQVKMKISPTLEQLLQPASAPVAAISAPAAAPSAAGAAAAKAPETPGSDKKLGTNMQALKEAIEKLNKQ